MRGRADRRWRRVCAPWFAGGAFACLAQAGPAIQVHFDSAVRDVPATGRLVAYLIPDTASLGGREPSDGPFFENPQPMFGMDVHALAAGAIATIDQAGVTAFPTPLSELPAGGYRVQVVLDMAHHSSMWAGEPGNLYSTTQRFTLPEHDDAAFVDFKIDVTLDRVVEDPVPQAFEQMEGVDLFEIRSDLLSEARGEDVTMRAGVVYPDHYDPERKYAAMYVVPGFGGDHTIALGEARRRQFRRFAERKLFDANTFVIILDPESGNGHHLFTNSKCNGPVGDALVGELVPALTRRFNLIDDPKARILRGHSSGGWSTVWLTLNYPETFGYTFSSAPDPVDFRAFQAVNLYEDDSAYVAHGDPVPSFRTQTILGDEVKMTIAQENAMEEVLGPDNTSGQQWDSWFAAFGVPNEAGHPAALWDAKTGAIDRDIAKQFEGHDIRLLLRSDPEKYGPIFRDRINLVVGSRDSFYLERAVKLLFEELREQGFAPGVEDGGSITVVPDADHGTVLHSEAVQGSIERMLDLLRMNGFIVREHLPMDDHAEEGGR
ncbi:MAG: hypothetical protein KDA20_09915 [Phycisphaerales bacterium]|nr:hypothetical protein [Phycisphaerales bacterium]